MSNENAPERIVIYPMCLSTHGDECNWRDGDWNVPGYTMVDGPEYIRTDVANALVAAALREAAEIPAKGMSRYQFREAILAIIIPDASAALDKLLAEARREGLKRAAEIVSGVGETASESIAWVLDDIEDAILAEMKGGDDA